MKFGIFDWANNRLFPELAFDYFEDAWGFIYEKYPDETNYDDYYVLKL